MKQPRQTHRIALQTFFTALPAETGMTFVVILHLAPEYQSALVEVLQRSTAMTVIQVTAQVALASFINLKRSFESYKRSRRSR